jgi:hypothetical protein
MHLARIRPDIYERSGDSYGLTSSATWRPGKLRNIKTFAAGPIPGSKLEEFV